MSKIKEEVKKPTTKRRAKKEVVIDKETNEVKVKKVEAKKTNTTNKDYIGLVRRGYGWEVPGTKKIYKDSGEAALKNFDYKNGIK